MALRTSSPLTRRVLKALTLFGSISAVTMLCSLVRNKLVALYIGSVGVGLNGLYNSVVEMVGALAQTGIRTSAVREIAAGCDAAVSHRIAVVRRMGFFLAVAGALVVAVLSPFMSWLSFGSFDHTFYFMALAPVVMLNTFTAVESAIMQGVGELDRIARASVWGAVCGLVVAVPMIVYWGVAAIVPMIAAYSVCTAVAFRLTRPESARGIADGPFDCRTVWRESRGFLMLGVYVTVSAFVSWAVNYAVMSWLNHQGGETVTGFFQAGYTLTVVYVGVIFSAMSMEYFPRISGALKSGLWRTAVMMRHQAMISVVLLTLAGGLMCVLAPWIVKLLYSDAFMPVVPMVAFAAPGLVARGFSWSLAFVIVADGNGRLYLFTELCSAAVCLLCTYAGYMAMGLAGIGIAFSVWYAVYSITVATALRRRYGISAGIRVSLVGCAGFVGLFLLACLVV